MRAITRARAAMALLWACPVALAWSQAPARAQERPGTSAGAAAVGSGVPALRNPNLERTLRVVEEVIEKLQRLHRYGSALSPERCRESAIVSFRDHVASKSFRFL